jgi:hypothetical protein
MYWVNSIDLYQKFVAIRRGPNGFPKLYENMKHNSLSFGCVELIQKK